jgi:amino acid adenylation domain-containing protein
MEAQVIEDRPRAKAARVPPSSKEYSEPVSVPSSRLHELFEQQAQQAPNAMALVCGNVELTYSQLNQSANQLAHHLRHKGVGPGVLVGICMHRRPEMIIALLGTLKAGGAYVPLDASYPKQRLSEMLDDIHMTVVLTTEDLIAELPSGKSTVIAVDRCWTEIAKESNENPEPLGTQDDLAYVIFTSGSTGRAKAAAVPHSGWTNLLNWFNTEFHVNSEDRVLVISSFSFDITQRSIMMPLIVGAELHLLASKYYDPSLIVQTIDARQITLMNCAPSTFYPLIEKFPKAELKLKSLRFVFLGGEALSASRLRAWAESNECRAEIVNVYGVAECSDVSTFHRLKDYRLYTATSVPLGRPIYNSQVYVVDEDLNPVEAGTIGEICLAGAGVGRGYINDAELTARKFVQNPFQNSSSSLLYKTGDLGRFLPNGTLEYRGRVDNQVKVRGIRVELGDIETALRQNPIVSEAVVITKDFGDNDQRLVTCVVLQRRIRNEDIGPRIRSFLRERLPEHLIPSDVIPLDEIPLTPNGKVDRKALQELAENTSTITAGVETPRNPTEAKIAQIFATVLKLESVGIFDSFFDLGGSSFLVTDALAEFADSGIFEVTILDFLAGPTVAQIAAVVDAAAAEAISE